MRIEENRDHLNRDRIHDRRKLERARPLQRDEPTPVVGFDLAAALASMGLVVIAALIWLNSASAAISRPEIREAKCDEKLSNLYLAGSFIMPGSADSMNLWVGKPRGDLPSNEVWGVISKSDGLNCEAQCKVTRFERFKKDMKPALMELDCEGSRLRTMKMPLHIQWAHEKNDARTTVRLGSALYGVEEAPLHIQVNRYAVASAEK